MHDFASKESKDMYYPELAAGMKHFKEEGGCGKIILFSELSNGEIEEVKAEVMQLA